MTTKNIRNFFITLSRRLVYLLVVNRWIEIHLLNSLLINYLVSKCYHTVFIKQLVNYFKLGPWHTIVVGINPKEGLRVATLLRPVGFAIPKKW